MKSYLVLERQKYLNGTYSTRIVAEFDKIFFENDMDVILKIED